MGNIEGGIQTKDLNIINDFYSYFYDIFDNAEPLAIFYDNISEQYTEDTIAPFRNRPVIVNHNIVNEKKAMYDFRKGQRNVMLSDQSLEISIHDIPQFSNFDHAVYDTPILVSQANRKGESPGSESSH